MNPRQDRLILRLIWRQGLNALQKTRASTLAQLLGLGGFFLAYVIADLSVGLHNSAEKLRSLDRFWQFGLPAAASILGAAFGALAAGEAAAQAQAPFLLALPLSKDSRQRAARLAALALALPPAIVFGLAISMACVVIEEPHPLARAFFAFALFLAGSAARIFLQLRAAFKDEAKAADKPARVRGRPINPLGRLDRRRPARLGQWSLSLVSKRLVLSMGAVLFVIAAIASGASLSQGHAAPAVLAGLAGGFLLFMLTLRCDPLASPALRATPLGFFSAWSALLRFPLALAAGFYAGPAAAAAIAEPHALAIPVGAAFILLALCAGYAVFAAFYGRRPMLAGFSYLSALLYTAYESIEYGRPILLAFAGLIVFLWSHSRGKYRHG